MVNTNKKSTNINAYNNYIKHINTNWFDNMGDV